MAAETGNIHSFELVAGDCWNLCYFRMNEELFIKLLNMVKLNLIRVDTYISVSLSVEERLTLTLGFIAIGKSFEDLNNFFDDLKAKNIWFG